MAVRASKAAAGMHVCLLRGINVGGKNKVPMQALREAFSGSGFTDVATYIQSGNVVFRSDLDEPAIVARCEEAIRERFKLSIGVVVRTESEVRKLVGRPPFPGADAARVMVYFCSAHPAASLDPARSPKDAVVSDGRHVIVHCPDGLASTKYTQDYVDRTLATRATGRNWRTVLELARMMGQG